MPLNWYSSMKKKLRRIRIIFDLENWLRKSEIGIFRSLDLERKLIYQKNLLWKSAIFHSSKLPFDAEVAEKVLNVIWCVWIHSDVFKRVEWDETLKKRLETSHRKQSEKSAESKDQRKQKKTNFSILYNKNVYFVYLGTFFKLLST